MNTTNQLKTVLAISVIIAMIAISNGLSAVQAKYIKTPNGKNISDLDYKVHITDIIPYYTYQGMSKVLSNGDESFEDVDIINLKIQSNDGFTAQYSNDGNGNFIFVGIFDI